VIWPADFASPDGGLTLNQGCELVIWYVAMPPVEEKATVFDPRTWPCVPAKVRVVGVTLGTIVTSDGRTIRVIDVVSLASKILPFCSIVVLTVTDPPYVPGARPAGSI
jgi:hypothetical protein